MPPAPGETSGSRPPGQARLVLLVAVVIAAAAIAFAVSRVVSPASHRTGAAASLPTRSASYLGVYEPGSPAPTRSLLKKPAVLVVFAGFVFDDLG